MSVYTFIQQVEFVAAMFELDAAAPLWLVKQSGNVAVTPRDGMFAGPLVTPGATYEVRGKGTRKPSPPAAVLFGGKGTASPFGAYCTPTTSYIASQRPPVSSKVQKGIWRKTIIVVPRKVPDQASQILMWITKLSPKLLLSLMKPNVR